MVASLATTILLILILIGAITRHIPAGIGFPKSVDGSIHFTTSLCIPAWERLFFVLLVILGFWRRRPHWMGGGARPTALWDAGPGSARAPAASTLLGIGALAVIDAPRLSQRLWNHELWPLGESIHVCGFLEQDSATPEELLTDIFWEPAGWELAALRYQTAPHHVSLNLMAKDGLGSDFL